MEELLTCTGLYGNTHKALALGQEDCFTLECCSAEDACDALRLHPHVGPLQQRSQSLRICEGQRTNSLTVNPAPCAG